MTNLENERSFHCNDCRCITAHEMLHKHRNKEFKHQFKDYLGALFGEVEGFHDWEMFECQGCGTVFLRCKEYDSSWENGIPGEDPCYYTYFPKRNFAARTKPYWYDTFSNLEHLQGHFILISHKQIYELIQEEQYLAALLTSRALLETIAIEKGNGDLGKLALLI